MFFMGIDVGTQGARCVISDENGRCIAGASVAFQSINAARSANQYEQRADDWWDAVADTIIRCTDSLRAQGKLPEEIVSISIDGTSGTIVPLDAEHCPLSNALMYNDMRASREAERVHEACAALEKKMGLKYNASFSLPRILWIKENWPHIYEKTKIFAHQADYIVGKLCGCFHVSDYSNALKTGYDLIDGRWPEEIPARLGIDIEKLPEIVPPGAVIAPVCPQAAKQLGLSERTLVTGGSTDGYASALASGATRCGNWASIIGTTFVLKGVTRNLVIDPEGSSYSHKLPSGEWMLGGASNIGGRCLNAFVENKDFVHYDKIAAELIPTGVRCYPLVGKGERFPFLDPEAEAFFVGNVFGGRMYAALMEGVGFAERLAFERMMQMGCTVEDVVYTTGGVCRSDIWLKIRASILGRCLMVPEIAEAAMGSAILAASATFGTLAEASKHMIHFCKTVDPAPELASAYNELYGRFYEECRYRYRMGGIQNEHL